MPPPAGGHAAARGASQASGRAGGGGGHAAKPLGGRSGGAGQLPPHGAEAAGSASAHLRSGTGSAAAAGLCREAKERSWGSSGGVQSPFAVLRAGGRVRVAPGWCRGWGCLVLSGGGARGSVLLHPSRARRRDSAVSSFKVRG